MSFEITVTKIMFGVSKSLSYRQKALEDKVETRSHKKLPRMQERAWYYAILFMYKQKR